MSTPTERSHYDSAERALRSTSDDYSASAYLPALTHAVLAVADALADVTAELTRLRQEQKK